jgi:hypothetical protein
LFSKVYPQQPQPSFTIIIFINHSSITHQSLINHSSFTFSEALLFHYHNHINDTYVIVMHDQCRPEGSAREEHSHDNGATRPTTLAALLVANGLAPFSLADLAIVTPGLIQDDDSVAATSVAAISVTPTTTITPSLSPVHLPDAQLSDLQLDNTTISTRSSTQLPPHSVNE